MFQVSQKTTRSFERIDDMPASLRECVHEFGEATVNACLLAGVTEPRRIRQLIREIWEGARQTTQRRPKMGTLDWVLLQSGSEITAKTLVRVLRDNHHYLVPLDPSKHMLRASMETVSDFSLRCTKEEKHRLRLRAAIQAGVRHLWPELE